jgi:hypothetical protein
MLSDEAPQFANIGFLWQIWMTAKTNCPKKKRSPYIVITTLTVFIPEILPRNNASSGHNDPRLPALIGCSVIWTWSVCLRSQHTSILHTGHTLQPFLTATGSNTAEKYVLGASVWFVSYGHCTGKSS